MVGVCTPLDREADVLVDLTSLVDKGLIMALEGQQAEPRFRLLETVRFYALECLGQYDDQEACERRHAYYYAALAERAEVWHDGSAPIRLVRSGRVEHDNLRTALHWCDVSGDVELIQRTAAPLWWFWDVRGYLSEGRTWFERASTMPAANDNPRLAAVLSGAAHMAWRQGEYAITVAFQERAIALQEARGDSRGLGRSLQVLGSALLGQGDVDGAITAYEKGMSTFQQLGDIAGLAFYGVNLPWAWLARGEFDGGRVRIDQREVVSAGWPYMGSGSFGRHLGCLGSRAR